MSEIRTVIKNAIRASPHTQGVIAAAVGVDAGGLSRMLNGKQKLYVALVEAIAKELGRSVGELFIEAGPIRASLVRDEPMSAQCIDLMRKYQRLPEALRTSIYTLIDGYDPGEGGRSNPPPAPKSDGGDRRRRSNK